MNLPRLRSLSAGLSLMILAGSTLAPRDAAACLTGGRAAIFAHDTHPDLPLEPYARGELGVIQPGYARSYLYAAYRHMQGPGFNADEQKALVAVWNDRLRNGPEGQEKAAVNRWLEARKKVAGVAPVTEIEQWRSTDSWSSWLNCPDGAFLNAATTLEERIGRFGTGHPDMKDWVAAQDQVFASCAAAAPLPSPARAESQPLIKADRSYQMAASHFYAGRYDEAEKLFRAIAADTASPWHTVAPYLAVRAVVRKATLSGGEGEVDAAALDKAAAQLKALIDDPARSAIHPDARKLQAFIQYRRAPAERLATASKALQEKDAGPSIQHHLTDFTRILDYLIEEKGEPATARIDDLTDWILTFQATGDPQALPHAIEAWRKNGTLPWLLASIAKIDAAHAQRDALIEAAAKVPMTSPAYPSLAWHRVRLLLEQGKPDEARTLLDQVLGREGPVLPPSARNRLLEQRLTLARDLDELVRFSLRIPSSIHDLYDLEEPRGDAKSVAMRKVLKGWKYGGFDGTSSITVPKDAAAAAAFPLFAPDSATALNRLPLALLVEASSHKALPGYLKRDLVLAGWVKAVLLGDDETARRLAPQAGKLEPALKTPMEGWLKGPSAAERTAAGILIILRHPGMRATIEPGLDRSATLAEIDDFRDNWWCAFAAADARLPTFLTPAQQERARDELTRAGAETAPNLLAGRVIERAKAVPSDPTVPEALHLAVKSTRFGCGDDKTSSHSKAAYRLLHNKYAKSPWAAKTKYHY